MRLRFYSRAQSEQIPVKAWRSLARQSTVSNPFYEHWNLLPALKHLESRADIEIVTAWRGKKMVGLFPLYISHRLPFFTIASIWKHDECYCTSPLVMDKHVWPNMLRLLWKKRDINMLINTTQTQRVLTPQKALHTTRCSYVRPALNTTQSYQQMADQWPKKRRKEWRRLLRKSLEKHQASYYTVNSSNDCAKAFEIYKNMESNGWKGRAGSALAQHPETEQYYREVISGACEHGQVELQVLQLPGKAIAASMRLISGDSAFEVKTSYCEKHRELAPGVLLEIHNMKQLAEGDLKHADSCTQAGNQIMQALWSDRVAIYNSVYFGLGPLSKIAWLITRAHKYFKHRNKSQNQLVKQYKLVESIHRIHRLATN